MNSYKLEHVDWNTLPYRKIWVPAAFRLPKVRPTLLLMHLSKEDVRPEITFWNALRKNLANKIEVIPYEKLEEAGSVVVVPHYLEEYSE